jgi:hypothetical protein
MGEGALRAGEGLRGRGDMILPPNNSLQLTRPAALACGGPVP